MTWELIIPGIAVGLSFLAMLIELLMHDREKAREIEFAVKRKQREIKQLQKKDPKEAMSANKELMSLMGKQMRLKMKFMLISFPMFILIFYMLHGALDVAPLVAGETNQIGVHVRNLEDSQTNATISLSGLTVIGANERELFLDDRGDRGDAREVWWNVTSDSAAAVSYAVNLTNDKGKVTKEYVVEFSEKDALGAGFEPEGQSELSNGLELSPRYKPVEITIFGMTVGWLIYYIANYFLVGLLLMPVKNRLLWGHWKGVKHLEKLDYQKAQSKAGSD